MGVYAKQAGLSGLVIIARGEPHVPIPNTTVKLPGPMIVPTGAKVGHRRNLTINQNAPQLTTAAGRFGVSRRALNYSNPKRDRVS